MVERREIAAAALREKHPNATNITVAIANGRVVVDALVGSEAVRYEHREAEDVLAAEQADASTRIKRVVYR